MFRVLRVVLVFLALVFGALSARMVAFQLPATCQQPGELLDVPSVKNPTLDGLLSGLSLGAYPRVGYGQPVACLEVDAGRGVSAAQWPLMVRATAPTWAIWRGMGFAVSVWVLLWALRWLWRAARLLPWWSRCPRRCSNPSSLT